MIRRGEFPARQGGVPWPPSVPSPASFTLTSYSRRATAGSWASWDGAWTCRFTKYCPVRFATVGDATRKIGVSAPFAGLLKNIRTKRKAFGLSPKARFVLMTPGWTAFTVTPVPASRLPYSTVNKIWASFDCPYALYPLYERSPCRSSQSILAPVTTQTRSCSGVVPIAAMASDAWPTCLNGLPSTGRRNPVAGAAFILKFESLGQGLLGPWPGRLPPHGLRLPVVFHHLHREQL